jgi:hypothetical protein
VLAPLKRPIQLPAGLVEIFYLENQTPKSFGEPTKMYFFQFQREKAEQQEHGETVCVG